MSHSSRPKPRIEVAGDLSQVGAAEWDGLLGPDDAPLLSWAYLQGLEEAGCVGAGTSWQPAHLLVRRGPVLVAAAPAYLKTDSDAEWVYDLDWAAFAQQAGVPYYPKLVLAVPFNPVTGRRLLCRRNLPEAERASLQGLLLQGARALCQQAGLSSAHVLFAHRSEVDALAAAGFAPRSQEQYHFLNQGHGSFAGFLSRLRAHRRHSILRERRSLREAGVGVRTHRGLETPQRTDGFTIDDLDAMFDLYVGTSLRYTGEAPYLNRRFFHLCAQRLGDRLELVLARRADGRVLAGAWNLRGDTRIFGRYWGEAEHVPFLHFEVCFYHSVERCIAEGLAAFEPGHGGDQKLLRGFVPVETYSAHCLLDRRLRGPIEHYLRLEAPHVAASLAAARRRCPLKPD